VARTAAKHEDGAVASLKLHPSGTQPLEEQKLLGAVQKIVEQEGLPQIGL